VSPGLALVPALLVGLSLGGCRSRLQLSRGDASVVVGTAPQATTVGARALTELEPNGALGRPTVLDLSSADTLEVTGGLADEDDDDRFLVELPPAPEPPPPPLPNADGAVPPAAPPPPVSPRQLALEVTGGDKLATTLTATLVEGRPLGVSAGGPGEIHGLPNLAVTPGTRVLLTLHRTGRAIAAGASSAYKLSLRLGTLGPGDEREPNESASEATPLRPTHTSPEVAGLFGGAKDTDWFAVPLGVVGESTVVTVELEPPSASAGTITVHDGAGVRLASAKGRKGARFLLRHLSPTALATGSPAGAPMFFVSVKGDGPADREHRYLLRVRAEDAPSGEREPNDDAPHATALPEGTLSGFVPAGDVDVYRIPGHKAQPLTVTLASPARSDLVLEGSVAGQARWVKADAGRRGQPETLSLTPAADGDVFVRVTPKRGAETEDEPYRISVETTSVAPSP
jgi:hypothetical protein